MAIAAAVSIYIKRDDLIMGPFSEEQTVKRYHRGEFHDSDLAMIDGMTGWHPLATYIVDESDDAPSSFDASAPPTIPQDEAPPRFDLGDEPEPEPIMNVGRNKFQLMNPVATAWALLGLGIVVMVLSRWPFLLYVPLLLASICLAVQQLARNNYMNAGPLLAVALLAPWFVWSQWLSPVKLPLDTEPVTLATPTPAPPRVVVATPAPEPPKAVVETPAATPAPPAPAPEPATPKISAGGFVALVADTKLQFDGKTFRTGKKGERFEVAMVTADKAYLKARTIRGQTIAVSAPLEAVYSVPPPPVQPHIIE